jgi:hypothetical protein
MRHDDNNQLGIFFDHANSPNLKFQPVQVLSMTSVSRLRVVPDYSTIEARNIMLSMILAVMRPERTPQNRRQQRPQRRSRARPPPFYNRWGKADWDVTGPWVDHPMNIRLVILNAAKDGRHDFMADGYNV